MQYTLSIDQVKSLEWGLNLQQAHIFAFIYSLPSWADAKMIGGEVYHRITKQHIANKLPIITTKADTVKKYLRILTDKGLIVRKVVEKTELWVRLTPLGKTWNTYQAGDEVIHKGGSKNNQRGGQKSPGGGDKNPQGGGDKNPPNTITINTINSNTEAPVEPAPLPDFVDGELWDDFIKLRKRLGAPNTPRAIKPLIKTLNDAEELREGLANEIIMNSYSNGWKGLFFDKYLITIQPESGGQPKKVGDRSILTNQYIERNANPGETWEAAKARLQAKLDRESR